MKGGSHLYHAILTLVMFHHFVITSTLAHTTTTPPKPNTDFIQKSCKTTLYPKLCYLYLSRFASRVGTSPRLLAQTAIAATLSTTRTTSTKLVAYSITVRLKGREKSAMRDCFEEVDDSIYELQRSMKEMGRAHMGPEFVIITNNIETWVSAALTDDYTCTDGFSGRDMNEKVKVVVQGLVLNVAHLTSIALTFVNQFAAGLN